MLAEEEKRKITKLLADQKAMRDAKYAARKQRRRSSAAYLYLPQRGEVVLRSCVAAKEGGWGVAATTPSAH